jgi:hypothetical protein
MHSPELSARTFCTFLREFSSLRRQKRLRESDADPRFCVSTRATCGFRFSRHRLQKRGPVVPVVGMAVSTLALHGHAAAATDEHVSLDADSLGSPWSDGRSALGRLAAASTDGHVSQAADRLDRVHAELLHPTFPGFDLATICAVVA